MYKVIVLAGEQMQICQTISLWIACLCKLKYTEINFLLFFLFDSDDNGKDGLRINDKESVPWHTQH